MTAIDELIDVTNNSGIRVYGSNNKAADNPINKIAFVPLGGVNSNR